MKYYLTLSELFNDVNSNHSVLIDIANEFDSALDVIGHPIPISHLANSTPDLSNLPTVPALDNAKSVSKDDDSAVEAVPIPTKETKPEPQTTKATVVKEAVSSQNLNHRNRFLCRVKWSKMSPRLKMLHHHLPRTT